VRAPREWRYEEDAVTLARGAEMGRFNMGSTVILVGPGAHSSLDPALQPGQILRVGEAIGALGAQATDST
jgi:phosphatidylserine decarboxylase